MSFVTLGWIGTCLYLLNHSYISIKPNWNHKIYYGGNLLAAIALVISSIVVNSWQAVIINSFWAVISLLLLLQMSPAFIPISLKHFYWSIALFVCVILYRSTTLATLDVALLGWLSAYIFSIAYLLFSIKKLLPRYYLLFNAFAALSLLPQLWLDNNMPVFTLEIIWALISLYGAFQRYSNLRLID